MAIALHRVRFSWSTDTHLEIEWSKGKGRPLQGMSYVPDLALAEEEVEPDEFARMGVPALCWRDDAPVLFERFQLRENTEYFVDITLPISKAEAEAAHEASHNWPFKDRLTTVFQADPTRRWRVNADNTLTISGQLRLRNHAGIIDLSPRRGAALIAEVVCRKIGYFEQFRSLLDAVAEELADLLLQYDSPVSASFNLSDVTPETEAALLFQLRNIMAEHNLPLALNEIRRRLHSTLAQRREVQEMTGVQEADVTAFIEELDSSNLVLGGPFASLFRGYSPREFPTVETHETTDTPENRYVKFFVEELRLISQRLGTMLSQTGRRASLREVEQWMFTLDEELTSSAWRSIGQFQAFPSNSQVLQKRQGYRDILKFDLSLRMSLELPWKRAESFAEGLIGDLRPVNELYEYWCFFLLRRTMAELCKVELPSDGSMIDITDGGLQVRLLRGHRSRVSFLYREEAGRSLKLNLFYNRLFPRPTHGPESWHGSYTARFDPDYSIEIVMDSTSGHKQRHWLHFDAKYRLETRQLDQLFTHSEGEDQEPLGEDSPDYEQEIIRVHRRDDLFKMHTYRDGILGSRGAYILFPGDRAGIHINERHGNMFIRHPSAFTGKPGYLFPSVGAFDLCPGSEVIQQPVLLGFLRGVLEAVFEGNPYQEETGLFT